MNEEGMTPRVVIGKMEWSRRVSRNVRVKHGVG